MIVLKILNINFTLSLGHCVSVLSQFLQPSRVASLDRGTFDVVDD